MKIYSTQEKIITIHIIAEMLQFLEEWEDIEELKRESQKKIN